MTNLEKQAQESPKSPGVDLNQSWDSSQSLEERKNAPKNEDEKDRLISDLKQQVSAKNRELAWYRHRVTRLEEQLRGSVDPELDLKQRRQDFGDELGQNDYYQEGCVESEQEESKQMVKPYTIEAQEESKSAVMETRQPKSKMSRKNKRQRKKNK